MRRSIKFGFGIVIIMALCLAASGSASVWIDKLTLSKSGDFVTFRIYGTGPFQFTHSTEYAKDGKPFRVFVDCQDAVFGLPDHSFYNLPGQTISAVRSAQYQAEPERIVRVVLDCSRPVTYEVSSQDNWVELTIVATGEPDFQAWEAVGTDTWSHASRPGASEDNSSPNWTTPSSENTTNGSTASTGDGDSDAGVATTTDNQTPDKTPTADAITLPEVTVSTDNPPSETSTDQPSVSEGGNATDWNNEWTGSTNPTDSNTEGSSDWTSTGITGSGATGATGTIGETSVTETGTSTAGTDFSDKNTTGTNSTDGKFSGTNAGETGTAKGKTAASRLIETKPSVTSPRVSTPDAGSPTLSKETATAPVIDKNIDPSSLVKEPLVLPSTTTQTNQLENYLQREKVKYSSKGRRDPFSPLVESDEAYEFGVVPLPNIENLKLVGVLEGYYENMALVEDSRGFAYILESGDRIKNGRVLRVDQDRLVCQISEYGWTRNVSLDLYNQPK